MNCNSCDAILPPNATMCPNCGMPTSYNTPGPMFQSPQDQTIPFLINNPIEETSSSDSEKTIKAPWSQQRSFSAYQPQQQPPGSPQAQQPSGPQAPQQPFGSSPSQPFQQSFGAPPPQQQGFRSPQGPQQPFSPQSQQQSFGSQQGQQQPPGSWPSQPFQEEFGAPQAPRQPFGSSPSQPLQPVGNQPPQQQSPGAPPSQSLGNQPQQQPPQTSYGFPQQPWQWGQQQQQPSFGSPHPQQPFGTPQQQSFGMPQPQQQQFGTPPPQQQQGVPPGPQSFYGVLPQQQSQPIGSSPSESFYGPRQTLQSPQAQQPLFAQRTQQQPMVPPFPPGQLEPRPPQGMSRSMMLLLVGLAVLLVLGGGGLIYYTTVFYPAQVQAQATMTAQNLLTMQAVNATGTALGNTHATATAQTAATAQAIATATALPAIYMQATSGNPVINDSLAGNSSSNWSEGRFTNGSSCSFAGGALHASAATNSGVLCLALNTNFTDFAYQVQMTILKGNSGGLIFRTQTTSGSFYAFQIIPSGQYDLSLIQNAGQNNISVKTLTTGTSPAIKTGQNQPNLVAVVARGSNIYLYVNQQYVASVDDNTISSGKIGVVGGSSTTAPGDVTFNNAKVWNA